MKVTEHPVPAIVSKPKGAIDTRAFQLDHDGSFIGIIYAKEPAMRDGTLSIHVSISKSCSGRVMRVEDADIEAVERAVLNAGLEWPAEYDRIPFESGPFKGRGLHIWQADHTQPIGP